MSYQILHEYYDKWNEYFEEIDSDHRWEAMACLLAAELKKERDMSHYYKVLVDTRDKGAA